VIVDTSAVVAIIKGEPQRERLVAALRGTGPHHMAAPTAVELGVVVDGLGDPVWFRRLDDLLDTLNIAIVDFTGEHAAGARAAYRDFGKGSGHPARLNLGDCFSYALARATGEPLLFTGNDFVHTDVRPGL
jgi:ribonuclease VapC